MSVITIEIDRSADFLSVVRALRPVTGLSIAAIRQAFEAGRPVFAEEIFGNNFPELADELRLIVRGLRDIPVSFVIREDGHEIAPDVLFNILEDSQDHRF